MQPEMLVLLVHIGLVLVYVIFIIFGKSHLRKEHIIPLCIIPVFGPLAALVIEFMIILGQQGTERPDLTSLPLEDDILWSTLRSFHEKSDLVPLEEAVLIDEVKVRRRSMLETLYADPLKYLDVLNVAKYNEDIETSHYATTTISKVQKDFQISIQKGALEIEQHPDNLKTLDRYINILRKYIQSGLVEENLLKNLRSVYSKMLDRKLTLKKNDKDALVEKVRNAVELGDYASASDACHLLRKYWPVDEQTWIEVLRVSVEQKDGIQLKKTIEEIQHIPIIWTEEGKEQVRPWMKMVTP